MPRPRRIVFMLAILLATGCAARSNPAGPQPGAVVVDRLWFGQSIPGGGEVTEAQLRAFMAEVVTPRFPDGLTLWRAEGQWRDPQGQLVHERVVVVEVVHPVVAGSDSIIQAIAREYVRRFNQDAVLHVRGSATMTLIRR